MWVAPASEREGKGELGKSRLVCLNSLLGQVISDLSIRTWSITGDKERPAQLSGTHHVNST